MCYRFAFCVLARRWWHELDFVVCKPHSNTQCLRTRSCPIQDVHSQKLAYSLHAGKFIHSHVPATIPLARATNAKPVARFYQSRTPPQIRIRHHHRQILLLLATCWCSTPTPIAFFSLGETFANACLGRNRRGWLRGSTS